MLQSVLHLSWYVIHREIFQTICEMGLQFDTLMVKYEWGLRDCFGSNLRSFSLLKCLSTSGKKNPISHCAQHCVVNE